MVYVCVCWSEKSVVVVGDVFGIFCVGGGCGERWREEWFLDGCARGTHDAGFKDVRRLREGDCGGTYLLSFFLSC